MKNLQQLVQTTSFLPLKNSSVVHGITTKLYIEKYEYCTIYVYGLAFGSQIVRAIQ
jgi:hypothetical protein